MKDWIRLRLKETRGQREDFERRYGMEFRASREVWREG
jgi:hypothetical protein